MHNSKKKHLTGRGMEGKTVVAGLKDRETNQVKAEVVPSQKKEVLRKNQKKSDSVRVTTTKGNKNAEKPLKIDDTPLNVARSFFGIRSDKFDWPDSE